MYQTFLYILSPLQTLYHFLSMSEAQDDEE